MHLAPYSVYAPESDDVKKPEKKAQLKLKQTIRVRQGDDAAKGTPPTLGYLGAGSIINLNGESAQFTVQEQSGSHSYTFVKGAIAEISGKTDNHITKNTVIWVVDNPKYTKYVNDSAAETSTTQLAYWQCKMKGVVKTRVNVRQIKNSSQPFSDTNSETLGLLNITAEFEFDNKDVVLCHIGGKEHKMAKVTLTKGGYADKAGQPPSPCWVCIDEPYVTLTAQPPTQFDAIVKCNQPIKAGDPVGFMGLYEVPKMPASSAQKVSKHQVHIEIFTTDSDSKLHAFLNNDAGLKSGKQYAKIKSGASVYVKNEDKDKKTTSFDTAGLKTNVDKIVELNECKKESDSANGVYYKHSQLPVLNGVIDGYIGEKELEILSQYELAKLGFKTLEEKNTNSDGYLDPEKMPDFFQKLYKQIDTDGKNGVDSTEIAAAFKDQSKREQLVKLIAKHPSEWHSSTIKTIKITLSNWSNEATEDETKALIAHEKERMDKLEWMSQIAASPVVFWPMVWNFNPIYMIKFMAKGRYVNYKVFLCKKGPKYKDDQVESYSKYNEPIDIDNGRIHGNSRRSGDAAEEVQIRVIDSLIDKCLTRGLSKEITAYVLATAATESGFNPDAAAGTTSASGLGQFVKATGNTYGLITSYDFFDIEKGGSALIKHSIENISLARDHGYKGDDLVTMAYKYHHDGPSGEYGGLAVAKQEVLPKYKLYIESFDYE